MMLLRLSGSSACSTRCAQRRSSVSNSRYRSRIAVSRSPGAMVGPLRRQAQARTVCEQHIAKDLAAFAAQTYDFKDLIE